jgi:histidinol-phosphate aminotransferase
MKTIQKRFANLPAYSAGKPIETLEREQQEGTKAPKAIKLASNENPLGTSKKAIAAIRQGIRSVYRYPDSQLFLLKEALAQKWSVQANQVIVGNGSDEIISLLTRTLLMPGEEAITADPSFSIYRLATLSCHAKPILVSLNQQKQHDLGAMRQAVTKNTRLIFICNPNNPTGTIVHQAEVVRFLSSLPKRILVVFDEAYGEYVTDPTYPVAARLLHQGFPIIFLRTFSKIYGLAGVRIGYGVGSPNLVQILNRIRQPFNVNLLAQQAALAALSDETHLKQSIAQNEKGKHYLYRQFDAMGMDYVRTEANFVHFTLKDAQTAKKVNETLLRMGVIIRPLEGSSLRVSIGSSSELKRFIRSLQRILGGGA